MKYRVVESTVEFLKNIEFEFDFSPYKVGDSVNILGQQVTITQLGGGVVGASSETAVMFVQYVPEEG